MTEERLPEGVDQAIPAPAEASVPDPMSPVAEPAGTPAPETMAAPPLPRRSGLRRMAWLLFSAVLAAVGFGAAWYGFANHVPTVSVAMPTFDGDEGESEADSQPDGLPVNTVRPQAKTLERVLTQPGTVRPYAQAELYAKTSGYLKTIQREPTPKAAAALAGACAVCPGVGGPLGGLASLASSAQIEFLRGPQKDIGSRVRAGEPLLEIAAPEQLQDVAERESVLLQRLAELEQVKTVVTTVEASLDSVKAQKAQAQAEVRRAEAEQTFRAVELGRLRELARSRTIVGELVDEKQFQVNTALAAIDASRAKVFAAETEVAVTTSKLATSRADVRVKEALVRVARDNLERAKTLAAYAVLVAPFDGIITQRGIDEGDFVQNSSTGQTRTLLTISAIDQVKVVLQVPEREAVWVEVGAEATLDIDARVDWHARGRVARSSRVLEPKSRTLQVEIDLKNPGHKLLPGMYGDVTLTLQRVPNAWALPATAVYSRAGSNCVLEVHDGVVRRQPVRIQFDDGKEVGAVKLVNGEEEPFDGSEELVISNKGEIADGQRVATRALTP